MSKNFVKYRKRKVSVSLLSLAFKKRMPDDDDSVPVLFKRDLYRDKVENSATH